MLTAVTIAIEAAAAYGGEALIFITLLSTLPIYLACRISPATGITVYLAAGILLFFISPHQCAFFTLTNGLLGLSLGISNRYFKKHIPSVFIAAVLLAGGLCGILFLLNIPALVFSLPGEKWVWGLIALGFSLVYTSLYQMLLAFLCKKTIQWMSNQK